MSTMLCTHLVGLYETRDGKYAVVRFEEKLTGATETFLRSLLEEASRGRLKAGVLLDLSNVTELGGLTVSYVIGFANNLVRQGKSFVIVASAVVKEAFNAVSHVETLTIVNSMESAKDILGITE